MDLRLAPTNDSVSIVEVCMIYSICSANTETCEYENCYLENCFHCEDIQCESASGDGTSMKAWSVCRCSVMLRMVIYMLYVGYVCIFKSKRQVQVLSLTVLILNPLTLHLPDVMLTTTP